MHDEHWMDIPEYEGHYQVSNTGKIKTIKFGRDKAVALVKSKYGYMRVGLTKDEAPKFYNAHRLVALAFIGKPPESKTFVNHINAIKDDNRPENLEWCTRQENSQHAWRLGLVKNHVKGSKHANAKVTEDQVREIRQRFANGDSTYHLAKHYPISQRTIHRIVTGYHWKQVNDCLSELQKGNDQ